MPRWVRAWALLAPLALALGLAGGPVAALNAAEAEVDPGARALVERLAAAVNADDVEALAAGMDEARRAELNALLAAGDRVAAMRRYAEATGEGLATVRAIIGVLGRKWRKAPKYMQFKLFLADFKDFGVIIVTLGAVPACSRRASTPYVRKT